VDFPRPQANIRVAAPHNKRLALGVLDLIWSCLQGPHDGRVLAGAVVICLIANLTGMALKGLGRATGFPRAAFWLAAGVISMGAWSAHFMALLAYDFVYPVGFDLPVTLFSALTVFLLASGGFALRASSRGRAVRGLGGAALGGGIAVMHLAGTSALRLPGVLVYDQGLLAVSVLLGMGCSALAFIALGDARRMTQIVSAALLLSLAIISLHLMAMDAVVMLPTGEPALQDGTSSRLWLAALIASVMLVLLLSTIALLLLGLRVKQRILAETARLRSLSDAAFEAIAICDSQGRIADVNDRLSRLLGASRHELCGMPIHLLFRDLPRSLLQEGGRSTTALASGAPVELLSRRLETRGGTRLVVAVRDLRGRLEVERRMLHLARHDPLTGLANRAFFAERLGQEIERVRAGGGGFALLCLDLDRFKAVNDTYGHAAGDLVLREAARRLRAGVRQGDFVARLGGDEFVILRMDEGPADAKALMAGRIGERLSEPYDLGNGAQGDVSASIGIARYPQDAGDAEELNRCADVALYSVKRAGRNGVAFYSDGMDESARLRSALEHDLRFATPRGELELYWQPQRQVRDNALVGFEALLRWHRPGQGNVSPAQFVSAAESSRAILPIGAWVLRTACEEAASWAQPLRVSVNISAVELLQKGFAGQVSQILAESGLDPARLELEIVEEALLHQQEQSLKVLGALKSLGVRVVLDDFGSGYAAMAMLRSFAFDRLNISRHLVRDISNDDAALTMTRAILGLGRGLQMPVMAEGVEGSEQLATLRQEGCEVYQGFLGGRPKPMLNYQAALQECGAAARSLEHPAAG
jgi:diguanylate cyclase (GGDEF)-like protein/PAS domain S-box-containing protein